MKFCSVLVGTALAVPVGIAFAQPVGTIPSEPVVVTATRTTQMADETLAPVTVITREDIERQQARSIQELLRGTPGISISNNGGPGKLTSVFLRGAESDHVLVLINGLKVGSATAGTAAFQDIPVDQIERIEIVRGPRSSLYGSEAIGGVIQIFTRTAHRRAAPSISLGLGSHETYSAAASVSAIGERASLNVSASAFETDGFNACRGSVVAGCFTQEPDDDGYRNVAGSLRAGYRFSADSEIDFHWFRAAGDNEFDGTLTNESETLQQVYGGRFRVTPTRSWSTSLAIGQSQDESDNFRGGAFVSRFDTTRTVASWQNDLSIGANQLATVGLDYQEDKVSSTTPFAVTTRENDAVFAQHRSRLRAHDFEISARRDDNEQFGSHTTGSAAWGYGFSKGRRLVVSYGTAFRAPTFNELFFPGFSNPNLEPEKSRSTEIALSSNGNRANWSLNAFRTEVDDLIAFDAATNASANVETARIRGIEAALGTRVQKWNINSAFTWLDPENHSTGANAGKDLPRRALRTLRVDIDRTFGRLRAGLTVLAEDSRFDDLANTRRLPGFTVIDIRGEYALSNSWLMQGSIRNLLDRDYETAAFFNQPGRQFFVTLRYQPPLTQ